RAVFWRGQRPPFAAQSQNVNATLLPVRFTCAGLDRRLGSRAMALGDAVNWDPLGRARGSSDARRSGTTPAWRRRSRDSSSAPGSLDVDLLVDAELLELSDRAAAPAVGAEPLGAVHA